MATEYAKASHQKEVGVSMGTNGNKEGDFAGIHVTEESNHFPNILPPFALFEPTKS